MPPSRRKPAKVVPSSKAAVDAVAASARQARSAKRAGQSTTTTEEPAQQPTKAATGETQSTKKAVKAKSKTKQATSTPAVANEPTLDEGDGTDYDGLPVSVHITSPKTRRDRTQKKKKKEPTPEPEPDPQPQQAEDDSSGEDGDERVRAKLLGPTPPTPARGTLNEKKRQLSAAATTPDEPAAKKRAVVKGKKGGPPGRKVVNSTPKTVVDEEKDDSERESGDDYNADQEQEALQLTPEQDNDDDAEDVVLEFAPRSQPVWHPPSSDSKISADRTRRRKRDQGGNRSSSQSEERKAMDEPDNPERPAIFMHFNHEVRQWEPTRIWVCTEFADQEEYKQMLRDIEDNGGEVVKSLKRAHIAIIPRGDAAEFRQTISLATERGAIPLLQSWVTDCLQCAAKKAPTKWRCDMAMYKVTLAELRKTRQKFTAEELDELAMQLLKLGRRGGHVSEKQVANAAFAKFPDRHTEQSWYDRLRRPDSRAEIEQRAKVLERRLDHEGRERGEDATNEESTSRQHRLAQVQSDDAADADPTRKRGAVVIKASKSGEKRGREQDAAAGPSGHRSKRKGNASETMLQSEKENDVRTSQNIRKQPSQQPSLKNDLIDRLADEHYVSRKVVRGLYFWSSGNEHVMEHLLANADSGSRDSNKGQGNKTGGTRTLAPKTRRPAQLPDQDYSMLWNPQADERVKETRGLQDVDGWNAEQAKERWLFLNEMRSVYGVESSKGFWHPELVHEEDQEVVEGQEA